MNRSTLPFPPTAEATAKTNSHSQSVTQSKAGELIVSLRHGLGNRLSGLLSTWVAAEAENISVRFIWSPKQADDRIPCALGDLFDLSQTPQLLISDHEDFETNIVDDLWTLPQGFGERIKQGESLRITAKGLIYYQGLDEYHFYKQVREHFMLLQPSASVAARINRPAGSYIAMHVRFTDHIPSTICTPRWIYRLAQKMVIRKSHSPLWICGDEPALIAELQRAAPERTSISSALTSGQEPDRAQVVGIQLALADMITLSRAKLILGSSYSSFVTLACILGNTKMLYLACHPWLLRGLATKMLWHLSTLYNASLPPGPNQPKRNTFYRIPGYAIRLVIDSSFYQDRFGFFLGKNVRRRLEQDLNAKGGFP